MPASVHNDEQVSEQRLAANLAALWLVAPALAEALERQHPLLPYPLTTSRAGAPTVAVETASGKSLFLHSRYEPLTEAHRLADAVDVQRHHLFHLLGLGLGYVLQRLFERASDEAIFNVHEPDLRLIWTALHSTDLVSILKSRRVQFFWQSDKGELFSRLTPHAALASIGTAVVKLPPAVQAWPAFHGQQEQWLGEFASYCTTCMNTLLLNGKRTAENVSRNALRYAASNDLAALKDAYRGRAGIVVSAGPSLRKNKHLLSAARDRAVLVAVQTTLKPLLEMGVEPHFVTSLDYHDICTRFYEQLPAKLTTHLVAEPKSTDLIFDMFPGPVSLVGSDYAENLLRELRPGRCKLEAGATVAHLAYYLAEHLGCDPIIFVGQDLGFSDGLCYAPGTSYEDVWRPELSRFCSVEMKQWEQIARDRHILRKIPDVHGNAMYTEERLYSYLQQFERDFARTSRTIIDATEGGALKRGATVMTLTDAIACYCTQPLPTVAGPVAAKRVLDEDLPRRVVECLVARQREAAHIQRISEQTLPLLQQVRENVGRTEVVNRLIGRIDALRAQMDEYGATYDLVMQLSQQSEHDRFRADRQIAVAGGDELEKQRRQVTRDVANVQAVRDAARAFARLMDDVMNRLDARAREAS